MYLSDKFILMIKTKVDRIEPCGITFRHQSGKWLNKKNNIRSFNFIRRSNMTVI